MVHLNNRSVVEDNIAVASTGYLSSPSTASGLASVEPGVAYDHRHPVDAALGAHQLSLGTNVSLLVSP